MATGLIPIPGSAGVSEFVFNSLFSTSPATPSTSFFYLQATAEQQIEAYNYIVSHATSGNLGLRSFFSHVVSSVDYASAAEIESAAVNLATNGTSFDAAPEAFKEVCRFYADTQASSSMASAALVLWRVATFIVPLIVAGFVTAFYRASPRKDIEQTDRMAGRHTLVDLQRETYSDRMGMLDTMLETSRLTRESIAKRLKSLAKADRRKKKKKEEEELPMSDEYTDVTINDGDDSL